ncbi:hypothetical protein BP5796_01361 [Coleophoma crateriformis]|uniref:Uncharacterized protein n=1 Tax=Coleophoma crateriformis TaxID=565419 RepID=A0A3D8T064_9HELO|nr:hypothetical protein BP5796_01361 [Coleophoma crateriformis]
MSYREPGWDGRRKARAMPAAEAMGADDDLDDADTNTDDSRMSGLKFGTTRTQESNGSTAMCQVRLHSGAGNARAADAPCKLSNSLACRTGWYGRVVLMCRVVLVSWGVVALQCTAMYCTVLRPCTTAAYGSALDASVPHSTVPHITARGLAPGSSSPTTVSTAAPIEALSPSPAPYLHAPHAVQLENTIDTNVQRCTKAIGSAPSVSGLTLDGMYSPYMQSQHAYTTVDGPPGSALGDFDQLASLDAPDTIGPPGAGGPGAHGSRSKGQGAGARPRAKSQEPRPQQSQGPGHAGRIRRGGWSELEGRGILRSSDSEINPGGSDRQRIGNPAPLGDPQSSLVDAAEIDRDVQIMASRVQAAVPDAVGSATSRGVPSRRRLSILPCFVAPTGGPRAVPMTPARVFWLFSD